MTSYAVLSEVKIMFAGSIFCSLNAEVLQQYANMKTLALWPRVSYGALVMP